MAQGGPSTILTSEIKHELLGPDCLVGALKKNKNSGFAMVLDAHFIVGWKAVKVISSLF
jgi:hypothetical protein